ncbi:multidrug and toxin extrusion protein 1-like isoform X2 [Stegostoma tigrinum]|uniref:multidrug and toxin extrusion protein 1-like isoform X2 n=1 Tax=Stegostoma tigrinum TaxID=3053191 RepID=UPI0028706639|nr:multidrug and toxin extrusion protein 1-like isoform X2 [Stegostoma tigrinum]XP_059511336.1 multidrug and toxin extrusion protein 1-like isoform X2 [Stegostoma tigrinum]XP_059511337.1 multidrug and toxin extrusion protein 1-like isoform X2 [Stegostoma tigrinum]XP_059511338.1 multidrug and toxin extrusion protein 1-like isoform X2 [Stegostoma tigrinum]XP_059511339.1 multidrug and toxin extrusion protein 1-like isoform X2 [Stegostoma tigrinum]XP_059511340.1 multidrug and toxin extrusion prote
MENAVQLTSGNVAPSYGTCGNVFLRKIRGLKPVNFWQEAKSICRLAGPVFLTQLLMSLIHIVSSAFCGHLGKIELDAVSLATASVTLLGTSMGIGLSTVCDTLISQTHGSKNLKRIGVILQRGILILLITCFPCWALFINIEHILLALKQSPAVAKLTQVYVKTYIPGLPAEILYDLELRYLQNQGIIMPQVFVGFITNIFNAVIHYLFLYVLTLGVAGSAAANVASQYCQLLLLFGYIRWKKLHVHTWAGWSTDCLQEWGPFLQLAIPSMAMTCIEWWTYQIGTFLVGLINEVQLGAHAIVYQTLTIAYMVPLGFGAAAGVVVGNALGAGNPQRAVNYVKVAMYCIGAFCLVNAAILGAIKDVVGYIFISDKEIVELVAEIIPFCAAFHLFDAMAGVSSGVLRGAGKQKLGAIGNLVGYYLIGFPIGIALMFAVKLGAFGFWSGMLISVLVQLTFFQTVICRMSWKKTSNRAQLNAGMTREVIPSNSTSTGQIKNALIEANTENSAVLLMPTVSQLEQKMDNDQVMDTSSTADTGVTTVGEILSTKQLIIRRGLTFLSGLLILVTGLVIHFSLEKDL